MKWFEIKGYKNQYEISTDFQIRSMPRKVKCLLKGKPYTQVHKGKLLKQVLDHYGYWCVTLSKKGKTKVVRVHKIILETFVGPCPKGMEARHLNDVKTDNRLGANLVYGTHAENMKDISKNGRYG